MLDAVCHLLAQVPFSRLQPGGQVGSADTDLLANGRIDSFERARNLRLYIDLRGGEMRRIAEPKTQARTRVPVRMVTSSIVSIVIPDFF